MIQNRYLIVQSIGKGGMGEVYLAVDQRLGSAVALKRTFFSEDSALGNAFEREARILARLRHPVLPKVIDHFAENGDQFLVMEHISGDDIAKRLENAKKPFPLSWVMFWADQMLDALSYLHSHEPPIVHRDIKPQNLKLTDDNHIVLLDFGLSKDFDSASTGGRLNSASVAGYSPHFASMEQIRGTGTDARSDLYSLSATLYQMLTNTVPPDALTRADALLGGEPDPILPVNELNAEVPPGVSDVLLKGLAIRQDERFMTAVEMQKALRRAFNKGKADPDAKPVMSIATPQSPPADTSAPKPEPPEMDTRVRMTSGDPLAETTRIEIETTIGDIKQSELQTAIFSIPVIVEAEAEPQPEPPPAVAVPGPVIAASAAAASAPQVQRPALPQTQTKKSSKTGLIIGSLVGLLILGGIAGGVGWYLYKNYSGTAKTTASPTPAPSVVPASPSPQAPVLADTNQNANSNNEVVDGANTKDDNSNSGPTAPGSTTTRPPQITAKSTPPKTTQTPPGKATPKPKGKDDKTVILQ